MNKVLLISPDKIKEKTALNNLKYPPLGLVTLAAVLKKEGFDPVLFDASVGAIDSLLRIKSLLQGDDVLAVGLSFTSNLADSAYVYADFIKQHFPRIPIISGGYHPTVMYHEVMSHFSIDYVVLGEGEVTFLALLNAIKAGGAVSDIAGISYRKNNEILLTSPRLLINDLDSIPIPAYELLRLDSYSSPTSTRKPFLTMIRSRGCPYDCLFCGVDSMFSHKFRCQTPQRTLDEIIYVIKIFNVKEISFKDSDFLIDRNNVARLCELMIKNKLDLTWNCSTRVDSVNKDILALMKRSGCRQITFGIESGSQKMLDALRKNIQVNKIVDSVKLTKQAGISCVAGFIVGSPGEDFETLNDTVELIKKLDLDYASFSFLTAFPGSDLYKMSQENKWFLKGSRAMEYGSLGINVSKLSDAQLQYAMRKMILRFYFNPRYIFRKLRKITISDLRNNFIGAFSLITKVFLHRS